MIVNRFLVLAEETPDRSLESEGGEDDTFFIDNRKLNLVMLLVVM